MKTLTWTLLLLIVVSGCSSSKIIPTQWASSDFNAEQINTLLVYANTEDKALQVDFENMVATALTNKGVTMFKMHDEFPDIEYKENPSQEEIKELKELKSNLKNNPLAIEGIDELSQLLEQASYGDFFNSLFDDSFTINGEAESLNSKINFSSSN